MADKLKKAVLQNKQAAEQALQDIPDGDIKNRLTSLLKSAAAGKLHPDDAHRELQKVIKDAGSN